MSKRNTQDAKRAARERLRVEREKQAKKEKTRRQLTIGGSIVGVLVIAAGIGFGISNLNEDGGGSGTDWDAAASAKLVKPANTSGKDGTDIVIGEDSAEKTLEIYEDMRCPACAAFEQGSGATVTKDIEDGKYKASFTLATIIDGNFGGEGSRNAASALGAALNVSDTAFLEYKDALYSEEHHPAESEDKFAEDSYLIEVAQDVPELKGNAKFEKAVEDGTYDRWALEQAKKFDDSGVQGTPGFKMDGKLVGENQPMADPGQFTAAVDKALKG